MKTTVVPYQKSEEGKKKQVAQMFNNISRKYDFLNHLLSLGIDKVWRSKAIKLLKDLKPKKILDIATGTGDFAIEALKLNPEKVIGVDISEGMLEVGRVKMEQKGFSDKIELRLGDSENLDFEENFFDAVIVAFGVRNFENLEKGLNSMRRVLRDKGRLVVLEFSLPQKFPMKQLYNLYFKFILPVIGRIVSKDMSAYTYLPASVNAFPYGDEFLNILQKVGYKKYECIPLTFGICSIYIAEK